MYGRKAVGTDVVPYRKNAPSVSQDGASGEQYATAPKARRRRDRRELTVEFVFECGRLGCTQEEVGRLVGLSQARISQRMSEEPELKDAFDEGYAEMCMSLRRSQLAAAVDKGNVVAQIWLGKQHLGQRDAVKEIETHTDVQVKFIAEWGGAPPEELEGDGYEDGDYEEVDDGADGWTDPGTGDGERDEVREQPGDDPQGDGEPGGDLHAAESAGGAVPLGGLGPEVSE